MTVPHMRETSAPRRPDLRVVPDHSVPLRRVIVVGGGIAGLAAAHSLVRESPGAFDITVIEAADEVGGKLRVSEVAGVPVDEGAESMLAARPEAVNLVRAVGLERDLVDPAVTRPSLWVRGKLRPMPPTVMGVPTDLRALTSAQVLPLRTLLKLPLEYRRSATRFENDVSVGAFVESRLGREVVDTLVEPLLGGVYAGRADALSLAATVPALFRELRGESSLLRAAERTARGGGRRAGARKGPVFAGLRGGVGRLPGAVADDLVRHGVRLRTGSTASSLHRVDDVWRVRVDGARGAEVLEAEDLIVALPPHHASDLLSHICPPAANDLGLIDMSSMAVVTMAYRADDVAPLRGSGFLVPVSEDRTIKAANYAVSKWDWVAREAGTRSGRPDALVLIRASVGRLGEEEVLDREDRDLVADVHSDLAAAVGIASAPVDFRITRWRDALPQYATGHVRRVERIRAAIDGIEGLEVCGAALDGVGVAAVIGSARTAARRVMARSTAAGAAAASA
jgi:oxygen-dependent protoporphyrinogen oxidase